MTIITGWRAIAQTLGVTQSVARGWREQGAPILLLPGDKKETVPAANVSELWEWLSSRYGPAVTFPGKEGSSPLAEYIPHRRIGTVCACPPVRRHAAPDVPQLWDHGHGAAIP